MLKHITDIIVKISILPFSDERFLKEDILKKIRISEDKYIDYKCFKEKTYKFMQNTYHIDKLDTIHLLIEKYYPLKMIENYNTHTIYMNQLNKITRCFICHRDGKIFLKYWSNSSDRDLFEAFDGYRKIELWNSFSRQFCMDILVINYLLDNNMKDTRYLAGYYWLVNIADLQLDNLLNRGVAENHIHINAGIYFSNIWERLMQLDSSDVEKHPLLQENEMKQHVEVVYMASIFRIFSAKYFQEKSEGDSGFSNYIKSKNKDEAETVIKTMYMGGSLDKSLPIKDVYADLIQEEEFQDIIRSSFEFNIDTTDENIFLFKALKYIKYNERENLHDEFYNHLFWKYILIKNIIYQGLTQNNNRSGLNNFQVYFNKATDKIKEKRKEYLKKVFLNQIYNNNLKKLEIRISPPNNSKKSEIKKALVNSLRDFFEVYLELLRSDAIRDRVPFIGVVIHFIKEKDKTFFEKCWGMEEVENRNYFYGDTQKRYFEIADAIIDLRQTVPHLSNYLVGIDAASIENDTEPWVFAPIYQHMRDSKRALSIKNDNTTYEKIKNLGFTFHVGEDFRHILSGLRHIDEVIQHFGYHAGDRIGHGIALGIDVSSWCVNNQIVFLPRIEFLENLLWLWGLGNDCDMDFDYIERDIMKQAECIFIHMQGITIYELWKAYQDRFKSFHLNPAYLKQICMENVPKSYCSDKVLCNRMDNGNVHYWNKDKLLHAFHCKCYLERMYEVIQVKINNTDIPMIEKVQKLIKSKVSRNGIVVETNPTSNLAISDIERLFNHYIVSLNKMGLVNDMEVGLIVTVNSDDPIVFNTSTNNELAYIFYLLQDRGYSRDSILEWINKVREWGMETSFVDNIEKEKDEIKNEISKILDKLT